MSSTAKPAHSNALTSADVQQARLARFMPFLPKFSRRGVRLIYGWLAVVMALSLAQLWLEHQQRGAASMLAGLADALYLGMWGLTGLVFLALMLELMLLWLLMARTGRMASLEVTRRVNNNLPIHKPSEVSLTLASTQTLPSWLKLKVMDVMPADSCHVGLPLTVASSALMMTTVGDRLQAGSSYDYQLTPTRRGLGSFDGVMVRLTGLFGLWQLYQHLPEDGIAGVHQVRIFADFKAVLSGNLFAAAQKSAVDGVLNKRRRGQGQDFHQIRSYNEGDGMRHVDWRATSRLGRLMSREYQDEQEQEIVFLIDSSQQMRHERLSEEGQETLSSHLDTVLNAMLLIANLANHQGDATGFISFSGLTDKIAPPKKGADVINYLLNHSFDIEPSLLMPDYIAAARRVLTLQKKRSLIILLTSTRSEAFEELMTAVNLLRAKHLVLVANLYENDLDTIMQMAITQATDARTYHSVRAHLELQRALNTRLGALAHVNAVHCTPDELAGLLVSHYFSLKRAQHF